MENKELEKQVAHSLDCYVCNPRALPEEVSKRIIDMVTDEMVKRVEGISSHCETGEMRDSVYVCDLINAIKGKSDE